MKRTLLHLKFLSFLVLLCGVSSAQPLTGTKTVGGSSPDYATLSLAIDALNTNGAGTGGVTFLVAAGHTEVIVNKVITTTTGSATNPIVFQKSGAGANPLLTAGVGTSTTVDGIIKITGTDFLTIDGIDLIDPTTNTTTTTQMEWGYAILKASGSNGSQRITIRNCTITLQKSNVVTKAIYAGNHIATATTTLAVSSFAGTNSYLDIYNNTIVSAYLPIFLNGYSSVTYYDKGNNIGGNGKNTILAFGGAATTCYAIYGIYQDSLVVANDSIVGGTSTTTTMYGIFLTTATNANQSIYNNYVKLNASQTTSAMYGIAIASGSSGSNNTLNIYNNIVEGCTQTTGTTGAIYYIYLSSSVYNLNVYNNIVRNNTRTATTATTYGIFLSSGYFKNIYNNQVYNNTVTATTSGTFYGLYTTATTGTSNFTRVYGNNIYTNTSSGSTSNVYSLNYVNGEGAIYKNKIYDMFVNGTSALVHGLYLTGSVGTIDISNNLIGDLRAPNTTVSNAINGVYINASSVTYQANLYHNSIYLGANSAGTNFGSNCVYANTGSNLLMKNNILVNRSNANGTGRVVAYRRTSSTTATYLVGSNNNLFYAGVPSALNLIYADNINSIQTIGAYQQFFAAGVYSKDFLSTTQNPVFTSVSGATGNFLSLSPSTGSMAESAGSIIATLTGDYLNDTIRTNYPKTGQLNGGGKRPDLGAYELDLIPTDSTGPSILFNPLRPGSAYSTKLVNNIYISDLNDVDTSGSNKPLLYFKLITNGNFLAGGNNSSFDGWKYVAANNNTSPFEFTINYALLFSTGSVSAGDTIEYFFVARDKSNINNINTTATLTLPATTVMLSSTCFPVSGQMKYAIVAPFPSTVTVGVGGMFPNLTLAGGLFEAINTSVISSNVSVQILSHLVTETGAVSLNKFAEDGPGAGTFTITISPSAPVYFHISGSVITGALIKLNGAERVIFDGSFMGFGKYLNFENTATSGANSVFSIIGATQGTGCKNVSIRNCNIWNGIKTNTSACTIFIGGPTVGISTTNAGFDNSFIYITDNTICKSSKGIIINGSTVGMAGNINILRNVIGSDSGNVKYLGGTGMWIGGLNNSLISANQIMNIDLNSIFTGEAIYFAANVRNTQITKNEIKNVFFTNTTGNSSNYGCRGINIAVGTTNANVQISNNVIYKVIGPGYNSYIDYGPIGIWVGSGSNYKIYNNSVSMSGNRLPYTIIYSSSSYNYTMTNAYSTCLYVSNSSTQLDVRNNLFQNIMTSTNTSPGTNFAIYTPSASPSSFSQLNYNLYYVNSATAGITKTLGYYGGNLATSLVNWKTLTGLDKNSVSGKPGLLNDTLCNPNPADTNVWLLNGRGYPIASVSSDFIDTSRSITLAGGATDIGAYQVTPTVIPPVATANALPAAGTTTFYYYGLDTVAYITWATSSTVPGTFELRYYAGTSTPLGNPGTKFMNAYWDIYAVPSSGLNYGIRFKYSPAMLGTVSSESKLVLARSDFGVWTPFTGTSTVRDTVAKNLEIPSTFDINTFTGTDDVNPLPVVLNDFRVKLADKNAVKLLWSTAQEINSDLFFIERGFTAENFENIGSVKAKGNSKTMVNYTFNDANSVRTCLEQGFSTIYYRLKQTDRDGETFYSAIRSIDISDNMDDNFDVSPNPFVQSFTIKLKDIEAGNLEVKLLDISGKEVFARKYNVILGENELNVEVAGQVKAGVYLALIKSGETQKHLKIVKSE